MPYPDSVQRIIELVGYILMGPSKSHTIAGNGKRGIWLIVSGLLGG